MIVCRSQGEIGKLRRVNQLVASILDELRAMVAPGVTTRELDGLAERRVREAGAVPAFKGYHGYPATICASVNEQVVHGIPSDRTLVEGDILSVDMGAKLDGFFGDCAVTVPVGRIAPDAAALLRATQEALFHGIDAVKPGARVSDIGAAVQQHVEARGHVGQHLVAPRRPGGGHHDACHAPGERRPRGLGNPPLDLQLAGVLEMARHVGPHASNSDKCDGLIFHARVMRSDCDS